MKRIILIFALLFAMCGCANMTQVERDNLNTVIETGITLGLTALQIWARYDAMGGNSDAFRIAIKDLMIAEQNSHEALIIGGASEYDLAYTRAYEELIKVAEELRGD
jgi:hypothetical protein